MLLKSLPKHSELTYGIHAAILAEVAPDNAFTLVAPQELLAKLKELDKGVMGAVRSLIAKYSLLRQGIMYGLPYRVVSDGKGGRKLEFAVYKRNKQNGDGRLASKLSLGIGGHIEGEDLSYHQLVREDGEVVETAVVDWYETQEDSFSREAMEEIHFAGSDGSDLTDIVVGLAFDKGFSKIGFVMDSNPDEPGYVGNTHFGVVCGLDTQRATSFQMTEVMNEAVCWADADELISNPMFQDPEAPFEPWSQMIIAQIKAVEAHLLEHFVK
jgi:predicted NUDIX family phosphoesterase